MVDSGTTFTHFPDSYIEKIMEALVDYTIVGGRVVYKRKGALYR